MKRVERILVPSDFSPHAARALEHAIAFAKTFSAEIHLLHAYHLPIQLAMPDQISMPAGFWEDVRAGASAKLEVLAERIASEGIRVETHLLAEAPSVAVVETAGRLPADLIVMGTRGLTGVKHVLLGSVAERTVRLAPCPVMTVKDREK